MAKNSMVTSIDSTGRAQSIRFVDSETIVLILWSVAVWRLRYILDSKLMVVQIEYAHTALSDVAARYVTTCSDVRLLIDKAYSQLVFR